MSLMLATWTLLHDEGFHVETVDAPSAPRERVGERNQQAMNALSQMMAGVQMGGRR